MADSKDEHSELYLNGCDDFHIHLRNEESLPLLVEHAAIQIERGLIMPNTKPPILTVDDAEKYHKAIMKNVPAQHSFVPMMSLYLTDSTTVQEIRAAAKSDIVYALKLYPKNATTNSKFGVTDIKSDGIKKVLQEMESEGLILCVHGECNIDDATNEFIDIFEREHAFIDNQLLYILSAFPNLKVILEHLTTKKAVDFVLNHYRNEENRKKLNLGATITAHHLLSNRNDIFSGNRINPHLFCLPILKTEEDRKALLRAATSGLPYFFGGSDSAPHTQNTKECASGCAGIYTMFNSVSLYAEAFEAADAMQKLNDFLSRFGAAFYGVPRNENKVKIVRTASETPQSFRYIDGQRLVPFKAGHSLHWTLQRQIDHQYTAESVYAADEAKEADCGDEMAAGFEAQSFLELETRVDAETTNKSKIPMLGLGTWLSAPGEVKDAVEYALKIGYRHIDAAAVYGNEKEVGAGIAAAIRSGVRRADIFVTSKLWNTKHGAKDVVPALQKTLSDLGLEYLDLFLVHWPLTMRAGDNMFPKKEDGSPDYGRFVPHGETWQAMEQCVRRGLTKHIGLSNFNEAQIASVIEGASIPPAVVQCEGHPFLAQNELKAFCDAQGIVLEAYSPLGNPGRPKHWDHSLRRVLDDPVINDIAAALDVTAADCCIRYQIERGVVVIPKSVKRHRIRSNFEIWDFELGEQRLERMAALDRGQRYCLPTVVGDDGKRTLRDRAHPFWPFGDIEFD